MGISIGAPSTWEQIAQLLNGGKASGSPPAGGADLSALLMGADPTASSTYRYAQGPLPAQQPPREVMGPNGDPRLVPYGTPGTMNVTAPPPIPTGTQMMVAQQPGGGSMPPGLVRNGNVPIYGSGDPMSAPRPGNLPPPRQGSPQLQAAAAGQLPSPPGMFAPFGMSALSAVMGAGRQSPRIPTVPLPQVATAYAPQQQGGGASMFPGGIGPTRKGANGYDYAQVQRPGGEIEWTRIYSQNKPQAVPEKSKTSVLQDIISGLKSFSPPRPSQAGPSAQGLTGAAANPGYSNTSQDEIAYTPDGSPYWKKKA